jgi:hypothetical protein
MGTWIIQAWFEYGNFFLPQDFSRFFSKEVHLLLVKKHLFSSFSGTA